MSKNLISDWVIKFQDGQMKKFLFSSLLGSFSVLQQQIHSCHEKNGKSNKSPIYNTIKKYHLSGKCFKSQHLGERV